MCVWRGEGRRGAGEMRKAYCVFTPLQATSRPPSIFLLVLTQNATLKMMRPHLVILSPALLRSNMPCRAMILRISQPALVHTQCSPPLPDTHDSCSNAVVTYLSASGDGHFREQIANIRGSHVIQAVRSFVDPYCEGTSHRKLASAN